MATPAVIDPSAQTGDIDVRYYLDLLWRGRLLVGASGLVALVLGMFLAFLQTPEYRAAALLQIEPPLPAFMNVNDALGAVGGYWQNTDFYNTQFKIITSKTVGDRAIERLKLRDREPFKSAVDAAGLLMSHVRVEPVPESRLAWIAVTTERPQDAALWANTIAEAYIEVSVTTRIESARQVYDWLQERLTTTQRDWREAQEKLLRTYEGQDLVVPEGSVSAVTTSITKLNEDYVDAKAQRIVIEAALKQVASMRQRNESLDGVPQIAEDPTVKGYNEQIASLTMDMARLKERYKEGHPEVQKVLTQMEELRKAKDARSNDVVNALRVQYAQLQRREAELQAATNQEKAQATSQSRKLTELETLRKEADSAKSLYDVLLQKLNESDIAASIRSNNTTLVEKASPPTSPARPDKKRIAAMALLLGLLLGVGLVLGKDYLDNTIHTPEEIERYLHLDVLATVPRYDSESVHLVTEAYQSVRTALLFARRSERGQVVLVTGSAPQEGKTTTLVNIGKLLASSGEKTLVVDLDLRRATLHGHVGLTREPGLTSHFVNQIPTDSLIRPTRIPNLFALTAGPIPPNPPGLLARKALADMLEEFRAHFAWILLDSPPLASVTDALLLARHADLVLLVVQYNKVDKKLIKRCISQLRKVTPNLLGAVLNAADFRDKSGYHYYYQYEAQAGTQAAGGGARSRPRAVVPPVAPRES